MEVPAEPQEHILPGQTYFTVQVATVSKKSAAVSIKEKLRKKGYAAYIISDPKKNGKLLYKIRIGKYGSKEQADRISAAYRTREKKTCITVASQLFINDEPYFTVQVATLSDKAKAAVFVRKLQGKGYPAYTATVQTQKGKLLYKVRLGKYMMVEQAKKAGQDYHSRENLSYFIVAANGAQQRTAAKRAAGRSVTTKKEEKGSAPPAPTFSLPEGQHGKASKSPDTSVPPVVAGNTMARGKRYFTVQVAAVKQAPVAQALVKRLKEKGFPVYRVDQKNARGELLYKIRIGRYATRQQAAKDAAYYRSKEKLECLIVASTAVAAPLHDYRAPVGVTKKETVTHPRQQSGQKDTLPAAEPVVRIYAYRKTNGTLHFTRSLKHIAKRFRSAIEYVTVFPATFVSSCRDRDSIIIAIAGKKRIVKLAGIHVPANTKNEPIAAYLKNVLQDTPLRLKCSHEALAGDGVIHGRMYSHEGVYINLDMIRKGIARFCGDTAPSHQRHEFQQAETLAKREKAGLWRSGYRH